jgi:hypothetical protein
MFRYFFSCAILLFHSILSFADELVIYISPKGDDGNSGVHISQPKKSIESALEEIVALKNEKADTSRIILLAGEYHLSQTIYLTSSHSPLILESEKEGYVTVKGSKILEGAWERHQGNIMKMKTAFTVSPYSQLYINGIEQILARYPNFDSVATRYHGYAADVIDPKRVKGWEHPEGAIIHAMHSGEWGGFHYEIESANRQGEVKLRGGHQNNRPSPMHEEYRMVENVYEELDTPREWYFNNKSSTLYYYPEIETNLNEAKIEVSHLKHLIEIKGAPKNPVSDVLIKGIRFEHTNRTFMEKYDPLLRSDWTIYRGGAILFENAVNCELVDCQLENLGGNAIFLSGYDRNVRIVGNHINRCGASAICRGWQTLCCSITLFYLQRIRGIQGP